MAIYRDVFQISGTNEATIDAGATAALRFPTRLRVRLTDLQSNRYGPLNTLRVVNKSAVRARLHFTFGIDNQKFEDIEANSIRNINVEDGYIFYGFDVENLDSTTNIEIGEIQYKASTVQQRRE